MLFALNGTERKTPVGRFGGVGVVCCVEYRISLKQLCFGEGEVSAFSISHSAWSPYPSWGYAEGWVQPPAAEHPTSVAGRGTWGASCRRMASCCMVLPYKNKWHGVSRSGENDWSEPDVSLCQQGRLAGSGSVTAPASSFAAAAGWWKGRRKLCRVNRTSQVRGIMARLNFNGDMDAK